jgi:hypothetical protein
MTKIIINLNDEDQIKYISDFDFLKYYIHSVNSDWGDFYKTNHKDEDKLKIYNNLNKTEYNRFLDILYNKYLPINPLYAQEVYINEIGTRDYTDIFFILESDFGFQIIRNYKKFLKSKYSVKNQ